jgi:hypothetical protein
VHDDERRFGGDRHLAHLERVKVDVQRVSLFRAGDG